MAQIKEFMSGSSATQEPEQEAADTGAPVRRRPAKKDSKIGEIITAKQPADSTDIVADAVEEPVVETPTETPTKAEEAPVEIVADATPETPIVEPVAEVETVAEAPAESESAPTTTAAGGGLHDRLSGSNPEEPIEPIEPEAEIIEPAAPAPVEPAKPTKPNTSAAPSSPLGAWANRPPMAPRRPGSGKKMQDLDQTSKAGGGKQEKPKRRAGANIRLAAMPEVKQPTSTAPVGEKVQKPDIALPQDAIKSVKAGGAAPLDHLTQAAKGKGKRKGKAGEVLGEMPGAKKAATTPARRGRGEMTDGRMGRSAKSFA